MIGDVKKAYSGKPSEFAEKPLRIPKQTLRDHELSQFQNSIEHSVSLTADIVGQQQSPSMLLKVWQGSVLEGLKYVMWSFEASTHEKFVDLVNLEVFGKRKLKKLQRH